MDHFLQVNDIISSRSISSPLYYTQSVTLYTGRFRLYTPILTNRILGVKFLAKSFILLDFRPNISMRQKRDEKYGSIHLCGSQRAWSYNVKRSLGTLIPYCKRRCFYLRQYFHMFYVIMSVAVFYYLFSSYHWSKILLN